MKLGTLKKGYGISLQVELVSESAAPCAADMQELFCLLTSLKGSKYHRSTYMGRKVRA